MTQLNASLTLGRLTLISRVKRGYRAMWVCRCACGTTVTVREDGLKSGHTQSCGCLKTEVRRTAWMTHGEAVKLTREYSAWRNMKGRCLNPKATGFKYWGGRGITVCDRWRDSFANFLADMGRCPKGQTLERLDVNGPYAPENCRWVTRKQQAQNRRRQGRFPTRWTIDGKRITVAEIADYLAMSRGTFYYLRYGYYTKVSDA